VKARFEECRRNRKSKSATPDELWSTAAEVSRSEGVSRTSTELRVEWNHLKQRNGRGCSDNNPGTGTPRFMELVAPPGQIQITPQLRILVAIDAIDGRKRIDSLAQLCRERHADAVLRSAILATATRYLRIPPKLNT
jgi:hypothetical protein